MANHRNRFPARRRFLKQSTALTATMVALPHFARAQQRELPPADGQADAKTATSKDAAHDGQQAPARQTAPRRVREPKR